MYSEICLNGQWDLYWQNGMQGSTVSSLPKENDTYALKAEVPGEVHLDLMEQGIIDNIYFGKGALAARWVEECVWYYRRYFEYEKKSDRCYLRFERLDCHAQIYLNGRLVGESQNAFMPFCFEVSDELKNGKNEIIVRIESGLLTDFPCVKKYYHGSTESQFALTKRNYIRKPQYEFGWDWSSRLVNVGIGGTVKICSGDVFVEECAVKTLPNGEVSLRFQGAGKADLLCKVAAEEWNGSRKTGEKEYDVPLSFDDGGNCHFCIQSPALWFPKGYGAQAHYRLRIVLKNKDVPVFTCQKDIGFRKIELIRKEVATGETFQLAINGKKIFCKGANWIPGDLIYEKHERESVRKFSKDLVESGLNTLRVWGGGGYETEEFYTFCNEEGILVWQDFAFSCCSYPADDKTFLKNIEAEFAYSVAHISSNPSLVIWCGGNEILWHGYNQTKSDDLPDRFLYLNVMPEYVKEYGSGQFYHPSSPFSKKGGETHNDGTHSDKHIWEIGFYDTDYRLYRQIECRFASEGGYLGPVNEGMIQKGVGDFGYHNFEFQLHDNTTDYENDRNKSYMDDCFKNNVGIFPNELDIKDWAYLGAVVQGEAIKNYIDCCVAQQNCSGVLFWMWNDCWPTVRSWSVVDWEGNRNLSYYYAKRGFRAVRALFRECGNKLLLIVKNDKNEQLHIDINFGIFTQEGEYLFTEHKNIVVAAHTSEEIYSFDKPSEGGNAVPFAEIYEGELCVDRNEYFADKFKDMNLLSCKIKIEAENGFARVTSDRLAIGVLLEGTPADNVFTLYPNRSYKIPWTEKNLPKLLKTYNEVIGRVI